MPAQRRQQGVPLDGRGGAAEDIHRHGLEVRGGEEMALYKAGKLEELYGKEIKERIDREGGKDDFDPNA